MERAWFKRGTAAAWVHFRGVNRFVFRDICFWIIAQVIIYGGGLLIVSGLSGEIVGLITSADKDNFFENVVFF